jgi:hypothetical protein
MTDAATIVDGGADTVHYHYSAVVPPGPVGTTANFTVSPEHLMVRCDAVYAKCAHW